MNKKKLIAYIRAELEKDLLILKEAERATREAATHEESKPENKYDTRALEASYLAGAQSKRVTETEDVLVTFRHTEPKNFTERDPISATALIEAELKGKKSYFFVMPKGGGLTITFEGIKIQVITPSSPLGGALLGLKVGDSAFLHKDTQTLEYEILSIQ
ncbi:MAG: GreA/GreB family elongation factor [Pseudobdellovibrionaceae bacterium]